ncbi:MAG: hypothetical protein RBT01_15300, partial [Anaerolineaceae bacterium]|nr:hypothetical protein [Anaerolineaceae bacterium]
IIFLAATLDTPLVGAKHRIEDPSSTQNSRHPMLRPILYQPTRIVFALDWPTPRIPTPRVETQVCQYQIGSSRLS